MPEKHTVRKVSMWSDGPTLTLSPDKPAYLFDKDGHYKLKLKRGDVHNSDLPQDDPADYCLTVTTEDGDHFHGEVTSFTSGYWYKYKWPKPDPFAIAGTP